MLDEGLRLNTVLWDYFISVSYMAGSGNGVTRRKGVELLGPRPVYSQGSNAAFGALWKRAHLYRIGWFLVQINVCLAAYSVVEKEHKSCFIG